MEEITPEEETTLIVKKLFETLTTTDETMGRLVREIKKTETFARIIVPADESDPDIAPQLKNHLRQWLIWCQTLTFVAEKTEKALTLAIEKLERDEEKRSRDLNYHA